MSLKLPEDSGRLVLAIFRSHAICANQAMRFHSIRDAFVKKERCISQLSEGLCFLIHHGCLRRGAIDDDAYYLTDLGTALIVRYREAAFESCADDGAAHVNDPDEYADSDVPVSRWASQDRRNEQ